MLFFTLGWINQRVLYWSKNTLFTVVKVRVAFLESIPPVAKKVLDSMFF